MMYNVLQWAIICKRAELDGFMTAKELMTTHCLDLHRGESIIFAPFFQLECALSNTSVT